MNRTIGREHVARPIALARGQLGLNAVASSGQAVLELGDTDAMPVLEDVQRRVDALLELGPRTLVVDMSELVDLSSSTIAALMWVRRRASTRGVDVVLSAADRRLVETLRRSGLLSTSAVKPVAAWTGPSSTGVASTGRAQ